MITIAEIRDSWNGNLSETWKKCSASVENAATETWQTVMYPLTETCVSRWVSTTVPRVSAMSKSPDSWYFVLCIDWQLTAQHLSSETDKPLIYLKIHIWEFFKACRCHKILKNLRKLTNYKFYVNITAAPPSLILTKRTPCASLYQWELIIKNVNFVRGLSARL